MSVVCAILLFAAQLGTPLISGTSTWYCHDGSGGYPVSRCTRGYEPGDLIAAAGSELPWGKGERVTVSRGDKAVVVTIVDVCACRGSRVIDLSAAAFARLGSLGEGVIRVEVTDAPRLPETDTEEP